MPILMDCPAHVHWASYEPALGPIDWRKIIDHRDRPLCALDGLDWIVIGGESGPKARPFDSAWVDQTLDQVHEHYELDDTTPVQVFVKQMGGNLTGEWEGPLPKAYKGDDPSEWPKRLRRQEYPAEMPF